MPDDAEGLRGAERSLALAQPAATPTISCWCCCRAAVRRTGSCRPTASRWRRSSRRRARCCAPARRSARSTASANICRGSRAAGSPAPVPARRDRHAGDLRRAARRAFGDRVGADGAGSDHAGRCPRTGRALSARHRRRGPRRARRSAAMKACKAGDAAFARARFEMIATAAAVARRRDPVARDAGYAVADLGADLEGEARDVAAAHARARARGARDRPDGWRSCRAANSP